MKPLKYINLGCGSHFHKDWVNVDFIKTGDEVIAHNLNQGIPFPDCSFDVVYHSHVLEHFSKANAQYFISECYRVLKAGGIIRVVVPDLEQIIIEYQKQLQLAKNGEEKSDLNYNWIMIELFDQMVRNQSGGMMADYLFQEKLDNEDFILKRIGNEAKILRNSHFADKNNLKELNKERTSLSKMTKSFARWILKSIFKDKYNMIENSFKIGKFRQIGEIHQWMYDQYSLSLLLKQNGFKKITSKTPYESDIHEYSKFNLDVIDGEIRKPDSLFMEAYK